MTATGDGRFIHSICARYLGMAIGVGALAFLFINWESEINQVATLLIGREKAAAARPADQVVIKNTNPALEACLKERLGHIDQMQTQAVINQRQHDQFTTRARTLCLVQNPS